MEMAIAVGILVIAAGGLVFFTSEPSIFENSLQNQETRAMMQTQAKLITGQNFSGPQPPSDYYCYKTVSISPTGTGSASVLENRFNCETNDSLSKLK